MRAEEALLAVRLRRMVRGSDRFMGILEAVRDCDPPGWLVGGSVLYGLVWDTLHGYAEATHVGDVDVAFFDAAHLGPEREREVERVLLARRPDVAWEAKNQAAVHLWYEDKFGHAVPPLRSTEEAIGTTPETATAVGVRLLDGGGLRVVAPVGLGDLFGLVLRRNPRRFTTEMFRRRVAGKGFREKWPKLKVIDEAGMVVS